MQKIMIAPGRICIRCGKGKPNTSEFFPLTRGHTDTCCRTCAAERTRLYRLANPDRVREAKKRCVENKPELYKRLREESAERCKESIALKNKEWRQKNIDKVKIVQKIWAQNNPEKLRTACKKWRTSNPEKQAKANKNWELNNRDKRRQYNVQRLASKLQATPSWANQELIGLVYAEADYRGLEVDHIVPLRGENVCGLHVEYNLQLLTESENATKSNKWPYELRVPL